MLRRHVEVAAALAVIVLAWYFGNVAAGFSARARVEGTVTGLDVEQRVAVVRDSRGIPHIRARNLHDLFFAQGFIEGSDRLFQMDVTRRYAYGTLAEMFGAKALAIDENLRVVDIKGIAARQWRALDLPARRMLQAFSDGVNAAELRQPLPVEYRMVLDRPARWTPQDSLAVSVVAAFELSDSWNAVIARDQQWQALEPRCFDAAFPLSDPRYDVSLNGASLRGTATPPLPDACLDRAFAFTGSTKHIGSNAWAAGASRTEARRALIANDPHVDLTIPGIWYVIGLQAPGFHAAGAVIPGLPGITLGHNERVAWAATNAQAATTVVYRCGNRPARERVIERFTVRFASTITRAYYRNGAYFSAPDAGGDVCVRWPVYRQTASTISTSIGLDRARDVSSALRVLETYRGSPENFIVADAGGNVAYHLAGEIPDDPAWGRYVHPARDMQQKLRVVPFGELPSRAPSRDSVLVSANNMPYRPGYRYRLSAAFEPPYRAHRIAALLHARRRYDLQYFTRMQLDVYSPVDREIARDVARFPASGESPAATASYRDLARWDGLFRPSSRAAELEHYLRTSLERSGMPLAMMLAALRDLDRDGRRNVAQEVAGALWVPQDASEPWGQAGRVHIDHPLSPMWYGLLRGADLPGDGDEYTIHMQQPGFAQGFRAVWDTGDWDAGGIVIPSGESGEPGSGHYDDLSATWIAGRMVSLPFTKRAVARTAVTTLELRP